MQEDQGPRGAPGYPLLLLGSLTGPDILGPFRGRPFQTADLCPRCQCLVTCAQLPPLRLRLPPRPSLVFSSVSLINSNRVDTSHLLLLFYYLFFLSSQTFVLPFLLWRRPTCVFTLAWCLHPTAVLMWHYGARGAERETRLKR